MRTRLAALAAAAALVTAPAPAGAQRPPAVPDATAPGPHAVRVVEYDAGPVTFVGRGREVWHDRLQGALFIPAGEGPFPVLLFLHGSGDECREPEPDPVRAVTEPCRERLPAHRGFDYLATNLASHGYLVASLLTNEGATLSVGVVANDAGSTERAEILVRTLDRLAAWHAGPGPGAVGDALVGKVDLGRLGAMGHSRGGDGVTRLVGYARDRTDGPRYEVDAVIGLAMIDTGLAPHGLPFAVVLPLCDADVQSMGGATTWDRGRFADPAEPAPRSQFTVRGANHSFFNSEWHGDETWRYGEVDPPDSACTPTEPTSVRITRAEQERIALTLVAAFFRRYLGGEAAFDPLMTGAVGLPAYACPGGAATCPRAMRTSYLAPAAQRAMVVTPEDGAAALTRTAQGGPLRLSGFAEARVCDPAEDPTVVTTVWLLTYFLVRDRTGVDLDPDRCPSDRTRSAARQLVLRWDGPATLDADLGGAFDATRFTSLTFRTGVNHPAYGSPAPRVDVVLRDTGGRAAVVTANDFSTALELPEGTSAWRLLMNGVRIPLEAFRGVRLDRLANVELRFGGNGAGSIQLLELGFQVS